MKKYFELIVLISVLCVVAVSKASQQKEVPYVIMVSIDGFRHDYVEKFDTPHLKAFIKEGAAAEYMLPSFPSKTFPNHYSLVTGLYPGNHGLVDNNFYDPQTDLSYSTRNRKSVENPDFYGGLPLWQLAQKAGLKSASYFWVGSEAPVAGSFPDYYHIYDGKVPNEDRVEAALNWLALPDAERPHFITLYFSLVDSQGHSTGPDDAKTGETVKEADRLIGLLIQGLKDVDLPVNVIVTSDHGMNPVPETRENLVTTQSILSGTDEDLFRFSNSGTHAHFYLYDQADEEAVYQSLNQKKGPYTIYKKSDFPAEWHYQNQRVGDIFLSMNAGHYLTTSMRKKMMLIRGRTQGQHGYAPYTTENMRTIFYAQGPQIKEGITVAPFENVDIYPLVAALLDIQELPEIDGDLKSLESIIK